MIKTLAAGLTAAALAALTIPGAATAHNRQTPCLMPVGWYANADEQDRLPTPTEHGLQFTGNDLIHHATAGTVEHLEHGSFSAHPAPDQPSFFSVEVYGTDGGYATLRWDTVTSKWDMVTGGQIYSNTSPAALVDMVTPHKSHHVISFGVGYTANPPGTVTTLVSSVRFGGHLWFLGCSHPKPSPSTSSASPSPSVSVSASASSSPSASTSVSASASHSASPSQTAAGAPVGTGGDSGSGALAATGPNGMLLGGSAAALIVLGGGAFWLSRRRRTRFTA